jgi:hypothetical protein
MSQHFFELSEQAQGIGEASLKTEESLSVGERLARYGSSALSGVEHLRLLVGIHRALAAAAGPRTS